MANYLDSGKYSTEEQALFSSSKTYHEKEQCKSITYHHSSSANVAENYEDYATYSPTPPATTFPAPSKNQEIEETNPICIRSPAEDKD